MHNLVMLINAAWPLAAGADPDVWLLVPWIVCMAPAALILLWVIAALIFLSDEPRPRFR